MTQNQKAEAICRVMGMPSRFVEKPFESPTLAASTADYMRSLSDAALNKISGNRKTSPKARDAAAAEFARRRGWRPDSTIPTL